MPHRKLQFDTDRLRRNFYTDLDEARKDEAIWEALEKLDAAGLDVGTKAKEVLEERKLIKQKFPK